MIRKKLSLQYNKSDFAQKLQALIKTCAMYYYPENIYQEVPDYSKKVKVETSLIKRIKRESFIKKKLYKKYNLKKLEESYNMFEDEYSKDIFLKVLLYRLFDFAILRFPLFYSSVFSKLSFIDSLKISEEEIVLWQDIIHLKIYDLAKIGYNAKLWFSPGGILIDFILEQYQYKDIVKVETGDNVLDCGACYGDTAIYFANKNQCQGKIYSFECMDENIDIFQRNMELNPEFSKNIILENKAVSDVSNHELTFEKNGPGTNVINPTPQNNIQHTTTIKIDDYVKENNIEKIDFIKMDIEGSEAKALEGAYETIKKYTPKLAICAYHLDDDLIVLPKLIKSLNPKYKLYLDHNTISRNETVIYAKV